MENEKLACLDLLRQREIDVLIVDGRAGSGKTEFIRKIIEYVGKYNIQTALLTPTGAARLVLSKRVKKEVSTIQSRIYAYCEESSDLDQHVFKLKPQNLECETWVIIDEASMVGNLPQKSGNLLFGSGMLLDDIFEAFGNSASYIFVGDKFQLSPIGQTNSPALDSNVLKDQYKKEVGLLKLEGNFRQEGQELVNFAKSIIEEHKND